MFFRLDPFNDFNFFGNNGYIICEFAGDVHVVPGVGYSVLSVLIFLKILSSMAYPPIPH